jgi:CheY-like chemotaxis protein
MGVKGCQGETVLAVEDNAGLRRMVVQQLHCLGYQVLEAECVAAALTLLAQHRVDLLLTDILMPGTLNGIALARIAAERWPQMRVVLTSGLLDVSTCEGLEAGPTTLRLLNKPYRKEELARVLREVLDA